MGEARRGEENRPMMKRSALFAPRTVNRLHLQGSCEATYSPCAWGLLSLCITSVRSGFSGQNKHLGQFGRRRIAYLEAVRTWRDSIPALQSGNLNFLSMIIKRKAAMLKSKHFRAGRGMKNFSRTTLLAVVATGFNSELQQRSDADFV